MSVTPIKPSDVARAKTETLPDAVIESFNELIALRWDGEVSHFRQEDVVERILEKIPGFNRRTIFDRGWLDVEDTYREQGWSVTYDRPGFNETYEPTFTFKKGPGRRR